MTTGQVKVDRVFAATDAYHVVNPNLVDAQIEGGVIFGMTAMMYGEITIKNGAAVQGNFNDYRMVRMTDAPDMVTALALTGGQGRKGQAQMGWGGRMFDRADRRCHRQRHLRRHGKTRALAALQESEAEGIGEPLSPLSFA